MAELERLEARLLDLAGAVAWPPPPDLRPGVRSGIARARRRRLRLLLVAAALGVGLLGGAAAATYVELHGETIRQVPSLPSPSPLPPGPIGVRLNLGDRFATLGEAGQAAGFRALVPAALGRPDEQYWNSQAGVLALVYHPRPSLPATSDSEVGALLMEARATVDRNAFGKLVSPQTSVQPVTVNGGAGFWVTGAPHGFFIYASGGNDQFRLTGDVLVWNQSGLVVRIESGLDKQGALATAESVR